MRRHSHSETRRWTPKLALTECNAANDWSLGWGTSSPLKLSRAPPSDPTNQRAQRGSNRENLQNCKSLIAGTVRRTWLNMAAEEDTILISIRGKTCLTLGRARSREISRQLGRLNGLLNGEHGETETDKSRETTQLKTLNRFISPQNESRVERKTTGSKIIASDLHNRTSKQVSILSANSAPLPVG